MSADSPRRSSASASASASESAGSSGSAGPTKEFDHSQGSGSGSGSSGDLSTQKAADGVFRRPEESPEQKRERRLYETWFVMAYFSAGFGNATKVLLTPFFDERGVSATLIGIFNGLDDIPVILRIPFGLASDHFDTTYGKRRPYIFVGVILAAVFYLGMGLTEAINFDFWTFSIFFLLTAAAHEIWDNQMDAYANEVVPLHAVGRVQGGIMAGSRAFALLIGFAVVTLVGEGSGWIGVFIINAVLVGLVALWVPRIKEPTERNPFHPRALMEFKRPEVLAHAVFVFFGAIPTAINTVVGTLLASRVGITSLSLAALLIVGAIVFFIGALYFGRMIDRKRGRMKLLFLLVLCSGLLALTFFTLAAWTQNGIFLWGWTIFVGIAGGALLAVNFSLMMLEVRDLAISGSFFAIMQTIQRGGGLIGSLLSGTLIDNVGFTATGLITMAFVLVQFPILHWMFKNVDYTQTAHMTSAQVDGTLIDLRDKGTPAALKSAPPDYDDIEMDGGEKELEMASASMADGDMAPQDV